MSTSEHSVKASRFQGLSYNACLDRQVRLRRTITSTPKVKQLHLSQESLAFKEEDTENSVDVELIYSIETQRSYSPHFQVSADFRLGLLNCMYLSPHRIDYVVGH